MPVLLHSATVRHFLLVRTLRWAVYSMICLNVYVMATLKAAIFTIGWLAAGAVYAQPPQSLFQEADQGSQSFHSAHADSLADDQASYPVVPFAAASGSSSSSAYSELSERGKFLAVERPDSPRSVAVGVAYRLQPERADFWRDPSIRGGSVLDMRAGMLTGVDGDRRALMSAERWLDHSGSVTGEVGVGYVRSGVKVEGVSVSRQHEDKAGVPGDYLRPASRSTRLSFSPAPDWVFQLTRGSASGLDYLVPGEEVRRTALSATYSHALEGGDWKTTLAWGRNSRKFRQSTFGYLLESSLRFSGEQVVFGRLERVGSDDLLRENESLQRQMFKLNKFTAGFYQGVRVTTSLALDVGIFVSRHFVPSGMAVSYGGNPTAYMMFMRVKLH